MLLRERARLLREVQKKKLQLERVRERLSRDAADASARMAPLLRRHAALLTELSALFAELLAPGRTTARARRPLMKLRRLLELQGVLAPLADADEADETEASPHSDPRRHEAPPGSTRARRAAGPEVASAPQVGQERRSLRELFRNLVKVIHPDRARHDTERERRTELMKEASRAYEDGDLARLLELERDWQGEQATTEQVDAVTRCRALEQACRELLDQVRRLTREIRDTKRAALDDSLGLAPDQLLARARRELDELEEICRFVEGFRDGALSVAALERGPAGLFGFEELEQFEQLFSALFDDDAPARRPQRHRSDR